MALDSRKNGTFQEHLAGILAPCHFLKSCCILVPLHGREEGVVYGRLARILFFLVISLAGCETTETARAWRDISHQKSNLTIISDYFDVDVVRKREGLESISEVAMLSIAGRRVGFITRQETLGEPSGYCGYGVETLWNLLDVEKNWISRYLDAAGVRNRDQIKLQLRKNQIGNLYYLDAKGPRQRCLFVGELGGGGLTGICTGTYLMYGAICLDSDSADVEKLDQQVFKLMNDLSFVGSKKELIKR